MSAPGLLPIETPRLLLRRMHPSDVDGFAEYRADAELARFQGWKAMSRADAAAFIDEMRDAPAFVEGTWLQIAIAERPQRVIVGDIGFCLHSGGDLELGFTLRRQSQGRGLATEALQAFVDAALQGPGIQRVFGIVDARNTASIRVLERLGMVEVRREDTFFKGEPCTEILYRLAPRRHRWPPTR